MSEHCGERAAAHAAVLFARGTYERAVGDITSALDTLNAAHDAASKADSSDLADEIVVSRAAALAILGEHTAALIDLREVATRRSDVIGDMARAQIGAYHLFSGDWARAQLELGSVVDRLSESGEVEWAARSPSQPRAALVHLGKIPAAVGELALAEQMWSSVAAPQLAGQVTHNLAIALALNGSTVEALQALERAAENRIAEFEDALDATDIYLQAGLVDSALMSASKAIKVAKSDRDQGLANLLLGRLHLATGRYAKALSASDEAVSRFAASGNEEFVQAAAVGVAEARARLGLSSPDDLASMRAIAETTSGRVSLDARLSSIEVAIQLGRNAEAQAEAEALGDDASQLGLATTLRFELIRARIAEASGANAEVVDISKQALDLVDRHVAAFGSTDLAVATRTLGSNVAAVGVRGAVNQRNMDAIFGLIDRGRILESRTRSQDSPEVRDLLVQYRRARRAGFEGRIHGVDDDASERDAASLERRIRELAHTHVGESASRSSLSIGDVQQLLSDREMLMFFEVDDRLLCLHLTTNTADILEVDSAQAIYGAIAKVRMQLSAALEAPDPGPRRVSNLLASAAKVSGRMLPAFAASGPVILIPPETTYGFPWGLDEAFESRPIHINPSPSAWVRARAQQTPEDRTTVFVAGPSPSGAEREVDELVAATNGSVRLAGPNATAGAVLEAIGSCGRIHFAAHGTVRTDNPLFSSLHLDDGPITLYELQDEPSPAEVILSSCSVGRARSYQGGLAIGMPAVLLAGGARTVVASEVDVPDTSTEAVMRALYQSLETGLDPASALSVATASFKPGSTEHLTAAAFNAYGA